ncbi:MFS transporter [Nosocomiicoccus sp. HMSC09A07]|uniref:MFS transporter n=1 Tax=Nosocomiicoccus sp. HMSC09A07 TaxID=1581145 RepID=UPI0009F57032
MEPASICKRCYIMRNIFIYFASVLVLTTGGLIYNFAISYYILDVTKSPLLFSINTVIMSVGTIISLPIMGTFIDKYNRKSIIIFLEGLSCLSLILLLTYIYIYGFNIYFLFFITAIRSFIVPVVSNAFDASLTQLFNEDKIQNILGQVGTIRTTVFLLGPLIAGVIYGFVTLETMILIFLILQFISLLLNFFLVFDEYETNPIKEHEDKENIIKYVVRKNKEAFKYIEKNDVLWRIILLAMIINSVGAASFSVLPDTIMIKELSFDPYYVGIASSIMGLGSLLATLVLSRLKLNNPLKAMKIAFLVLAIVMTTFTLPVYVNMNNIYSLVYLSLIGLTMAFTFQFVSIPMMSYMQKSIDNQFKGRVFSLLNTLGNVLLPIGTLIFGALYEMKIYFSANLFSSIIVIIVASLLLNNSVIRKSKTIYNNKIQL